MPNLLTFLLAAALQAQGETRTASAPDSIDALSDSVRRARREQRHEHHSNVLRARKSRTPLTPALLANAYRDASAREIVTRALAGMFEMSPVPYFPGRGGLLRFTGMERVTDQEGLFIPPLADSAEAYYRYDTGDTISYSLPEGRTIRIVEINVVAREPAFDLILGSIWFDLASAQVVRAAYRPAAPFDIKKFVEEEEGEEEFDDVPRAVRPLIFPMIATLEAFTVE